GDGLRRLAVEERVYDGVQGHTRPSNHVRAVTLLDVGVGHRPSPILRLGAAQIKRSSCRSLSGSCWITRKSSRTPARTITPKASGSSASGTGSSPPSRD